MTASFKNAVTRLLTPPVDLIPAKASTFKYVLFRNRIWTTKEFLSPEEWNALVREYDERKRARLQGVVQRFEAAPRPFANVSVPKLAGCRQLPLLGLGQGKTRARMLASSACGSSGRHLKMPPCTLWVACSPPWWMLGGA